MKRVMSSVGAVFVFMAALTAQVPDAPKISPFFSTRTFAPAFWIECRNRSDRSISLLDAIGKYRIDGVEPPNRGRGGSLPPTEISPGGTYRGIVVLIQPSPGSTGTYTTSGATSVLYASHVITPGRHTIAAQCLGVWSDTFEFYWESPTAGTAAENSR